MRDALTLRYVPGFRFAPGGPASPQTTAAMRLPTVIPRAGLLLGFAALLPLAVGGALAAWQWQAVTRAAQARTMRQVALAREEMAATIALDRLALDELAAGPLGPRPPAIPERAAVAGGVRALFVLDAAGRPHSGSAGRAASGKAVKDAPATTQEKTTSLAGRGFFRVLRDGAAFAAGAGCPVGTEPSPGFVLARPLPAPAGTFRGAIGACVHLGALRRAWRARLRAGESLLVIRLPRAAEPQAVSVAPAIAVPTARIQVAARPLPAAAASGATVPAAAPAWADPTAAILLRAGIGTGTMPEAQVAATRIAAIGGTGLVVAFTPAPGARLAAWLPIALGLGLGAVLIAVLAVLALRALLLWRLRMGEQVAASTRFAEVMRIGADRYRQFFSGAPVALCVLDPARRILAVNETWLTLLGYRREEVTGQPIEGFLAPADRGTAEHDWTRLLAGDTPGPRPRRLLRRDGSLFAAMVLERIERGPDGLIRRAGAVILEAPPETPAGVRRDALARVVGGIAHDFNNLLMVLMGNLERLGAQAERADIVRRLSGMALVAAERGAGLTARLLAAAGTQALRPELVNANRLLREAAAEIERVAGAKVEVQFVFSPVLDPVRLDPARFTTVVLALVANARESMPRGGRLTVETANLPAVETANPPAAATATMPGPAPGAGRIAISFADTGLGMTPEVLARATEPFFTTRPPGRASGLGLSMADGFARQTGGVLELRSDVGIGTTVALVLPRSADAAGAVEGDAAEQDAHGEAVRMDPRPGG